jgi:uncharacterized membrane protein YhaH (DUF805 family)
LVKYAKFNGRASRSEYWWFELFNLLVLVIAVIPMALVDHQRENSLWSAIGIAVFGVALLALLLPNIAVGVRRLHDLGHSGWWYLTLIVPYVGGLAGLAMTIAFCLRGTAGANRFGEDPLVPETQRLVQQF